MKNFLFTPLLLLVLAVSCKKEETAAPVAVDALVAYPGKNRAMVTFSVPPGAVRGKVFYNSGSFKEFDVTGAEQSVVVDDLSEQEHILKVVTINAEGRVSDPKAVKAQVYGAGYEGGLKPRRWKDQINHSPTSIEIVFEPAFENETDVVVFFTNTSGKKDSVDMPATNNSIVLNSIDISQPYYFYSRYKPETSAIDHFLSSNVDAKSALLFNFQKSGWKVAGVSDEVAGRSAAMAIDNNTATLWQSSASAPKPAAQHWITVDMGTSKVIDGFNLLHSYTNEKSAKKIRIDISLDNTTWTTALEGTLNVSFLRQVLPLQKSVNARYFRITAVEMFDANTPGLVFSEIDVYNAQTTSGDNGHTSYSSGTAVAMTNAKNPFVGDGSNPFPTLGDYRLQKVLGWTHSTNAIATFDNAKLSLFTASVWGLPVVTNGKLHQTLNLQPGNYVLKINVAGADGPVDIYGMVVRGSALPDYGTVTAANTVMRYADLMAFQNKVVELPFNVSVAGAVSIGVVYNIRSQYSINQKPWSTFTINGFELTRVVL
ncbi:DUF4998 domain-containing protein [Niabella yanshanensis]|uniref:DUF4998 domain-containing protein n=1 Tax=Niabella yanshanensis TaxID=577386 RepID=A0ABZ0W7M4_9BACT|nr:DUF4998 domain-containing protein [Niabella yanshanensis]WQD38534.1 DUF4998 domain-containing protein [Niabella yanshanensis]